ncbi:hypothetical protein K493DRAFT_339880 [Basidiobolus meristosporus CBS 931.73]|uniref:Pentacotripeptide-repeat region of PRORP domain-containing protein n=1 Tax=Basidiobolus meristosporus CBS 931.73 TaxID=1314790 RepID=A0A1Y1XY30_9FUNG|nr:hypothetical protein K493DRAFT_339880 [Basidiobolus meristosporus CBS 931.73]|eukprot:ORX90657.1 hypothetical protein K493DRAFT_339880 [Basidiobolus meristosporus CBS 931.73]
MFHLACRNVVKANWRGAQTLQLARNFSGASINLGKRSLPREVKTKGITVPKDAYLMSDKIKKLASNDKLADAIALVMNSPLRAQSTVVWNHLIDECGKKQMVGKAFKLFQEMKRRGHAPNEKTFTILINACANSVSASPTALQKALELYNKMVQSDSPPSLVHTNTLIKACSRAGDMKTLADSYNSLDTRGPGAPDVVTYNLVISAFAHKGGDDGFKFAFQVWEDFRRDLRQYEKSQVKRQDDYDPYADLYQSQRRRTIPERNMRLDVEIVNSILLACKNADSKENIEQAFTILSDVYGLGRVREKLSHYGLGNEADELSNIENAAYLRPKRSTVDLIIGICLKAKEFQRGVDYYSEIVQKYPTLQLDIQNFSTVSFLFLRRIAEIHGHRGSLYDSQSFKVRRNIENADGK